MPLLMHGLRSNKNARRLIKWIGLSFFLIGMFFLLTFGNSQFIANNPGGNDFLIPWIGARSFLEEGISPYSSEVHSRVDLVVYGRPSKPGDMELPLSYPIYYLIFYVPFAMIKDYSLARAAWMTFQEMVVIAIAIGNLSLVNWKPTRWLLIVYLVFSLLWYHALRSLINGNIVILITLAISGSLWLIRMKEDAAAGIVLGLATVKPNVVLPFLIWICLWALLSKRWRIMAWMVGTVTCLSIIGLFLVPNWPFQNLQEILRYPNYPPGTPSSIFAAWLPGSGQWIGRLLSFGTIIFLVYEWLRTPQNNYQAWLWTTCLTLTLSPWIGITSDPGNNIMSSLGLVLLLAISTQRFGNLVRLIGMLFLFFGPWILFLATIVRTDQPIQNPIMFFPIPAVLLIGLLFGRARWIAGGSGMQASFGEWDNQVSAI